MNLLRWRIKPIHWFLGLVGLISVLTYGVDVHAAPVTKESIVTPQRSSPYDTQLFQIGTNRTNGYTEADGFLKGSTEIGGHHVVRNIGEGKQPVTMLKVYAPYGTQTAKVTFKVARCVFDLTAAENTENRRLQVEVSNSNTDINSTSTPYDVAAERGRRDDGKWRTSSNAKPCYGGTKLDAKTYSVALSPDNTTGMSAGYLTVRLTGSHTGTKSNTIWFEAFSDAGNYISYRSGSGGAGARGYGINLKGNRGTKAILPFGLPCNYSSASANASVYMYDPDPGFGQQDISIYERKPGGTWRVMPGLDHFALTLGNNQTTEIPISSIKREYQYVMVFYNPDTSSTNPASNTISFGIPFDSINGMINCSYNLRPTISINKSSFAIQSDLGPVGGVSNGNSGNSFGVSDVHEWRVTKAVFTSKPQASQLLQADNTTPVCAFLNSKGRVAPGGSCRIVGDRLQYPAASSWTDAGATGEVPAGSYVCYMTSVSKPTSASDASLWRHSAPVCAVSVKKPNVHILGSDLKVYGVNNVNGRISTAMTTVDRKTYGSWVEYGVFSTGINQTASSGSGLRKGSEGARLDWSKLTFTNTATNYGNYTSPLPGGRDAVTFFGGLTDYISYSGSTVPSTSGVYRYSGNATINASSINAAQKGTSVIIQAPNGTVTIDGNISVDNSGRNSPGEISQVVIIARNINIKGNVDGIDAWLLTPTGGTINTCSDVPENQPLITTTCNKQLTVNGAVSAKLLLRRTAGAGAADLEVAAETFRLRPDAQLWAYGYANKGDRAQTVYLKELPPRF